jgi:hypothetical protein
VGFLPVCTCKVLLVAAMTKPYIMGPSIASIELLKQGIVACIFSPALTPSKGIFRLAVTSVKDVHSYKCMKLSVTRIRKSAFLGFLANFLLPVSYLQ